MLQLDFNYSPWFMLLCAVIAGLVAWLLYRGMGDVLPTWAKWVLSSIRFIVIFILAVLLLEPLLNSFTRLKSPPIVTILQDNSESILIQKDSLFVKNEYPALLKAFVKDLESADISVQLMSFGSKLNGTSGVDSLTFDESGTNISGALTELKKIYANQNLGAVVLITDGISTAGANTLYSLEGVSQPVHTVLLGDTTRQKDLRIAGVLFNEIAYLKNETPIRLKIQSDGFEEAKVKVTLTRNGKTLDSKDLNLTTDNANQDVDFLINPEETGLQQYNLSVTRLEGELTWRNNSRSIFINVLETRVKIALFAGATHPDIGTIRTSLRRDDRYEITEFIHKDRQNYFESPLNHNLADFDLVILHNFPFSPGDGEMVGKIAEQVRNRNLPIMAFMGIFTDLKTAKPLFEYLALNPTVLSQASEEAMLRFLPNYENHSSFTFSSDWIKLMNQAPPLLRNRSDWQPKPDATVYGASTIKTVQLDYPIFALQQHLSRKNMTFVGENFWRVRAHSYIESGDFEPFDQWIYNLIQWLIVKEDKRKFKVAPAKPLFSGNEKIIFKGQAYDDSYNPIQGAEIKLSLKGPSGKEDIYYLSESGEARYYLELSNLEEGTYTYFAEGKKGDALIGKDRGQFSIGKSNIEHFQLTADNGLLQQISLRTGASYTHARNLAALASAIKAQENMKPVVELKKSRLGFQEFGWLMALLFFLLTTEWVLRKMYSLV